MTLALSCPPFAGVFIADVLRVSGEGARSIVQIGEDLRVRGVDLSSGDDLFDLVNPSGEEMLDLVDLPSGDDADDLHDLGSEKYDECMSAASIGLCSRLD